MSDDPRWLAAFPALSARDIEALAAIGERRAFEDGEAVFSVGEDGGGFHVVLSGSIEIIDSSTGEDRHVVTHGPGQFTGDIDILRGRRPVVSGVARGETGTLAIRSSEIRHVIGNVPGLGERILLAFITRRELLLESEFEGLRVIGCSASRDSFRIREFLSRNQIRFRWIDLDEEPHVEELLEQFGVQGRGVPVVAFGGRALLHNPTNRELADLLGLRTTSERTAYDLVIVGAGPAGLAAAVYGASEGLATLVVDGVGPGGQAGTSTKIENYLGFPTGISGGELASRALIQARKFGADFATPTEVTGMALDGGGLALDLDEGRTIRARSVLVATGAEYRKLDVPGRDELDGVGVYYAATQMELASCRGSVVVVVGAGNSAGQAAMFLSEHTARVLLLVRGKSLRTSMSSYLADRIERVANIEVRYRTEIRRMAGDGRLRSIDIEDTGTGETHTVETPAVFTFIGAAPFTAWLPADIGKDAAGFVRTGPSASAGGWTVGRAPFYLETSWPGVFAAGDVRVGSTKRVASAVGEGAIAVKYVHEHLADGLVYS